jgi:hypothetical protein
MICQWFDLKITRMVFSGLASKPMATISWLSLKTMVVEGFLVWASKPVDTFGDLELKIIVTVSWFVP